MNSPSPQNDPSGIPPTLATARAGFFWAAVVPTGAGAGIASVLLLRLLYVVQYTVWPGPHILDAAAASSAWHHLTVLAAAGVATGLGQFVLGRLSSGNSIDLTEAITLFAGRLPALRTLGSALLSMVVVGMGASLGREGAPKQVGAILANALSDRARLSDEQRRLLVACGAGAGMAAAYGVPLGGALFAVEVLRGVLALRLILPALFACAIATGIAWLGLPNEPTYVIPAYSMTASVICWSLIAGPLMGCLSVVFVRMVAWADAHKPKGLHRFFAPLLGLSALGGLSIAFPQLLGNGKDIAELAFTGQVPVPLLLTLFLLKPMVTVLCLGVGAPGGLFTPSLATGGLLGGALGALWSWLWPGTPLGMFAIIGAATVLAATTRGPISAVVLVMELTGRDRSFLLPMLLAVVTATVVARTLDSRSIYDVRFSEHEVRALQEQRKPAAA